MLKYLFIFIAIIALAIPSVVNGATLGVAPSKVNLTIQNGDTTTCNFLVSGFTGTLKITPIDIPVEISPSEVEIIQDPQSILLTFKNTDDIGTHSGLIKFSTDNASVVLVVNVQATISVVLEATVTSGGGGGGGGGGGYIPPTTSPTPSPTIIVPTFTPIPTVVAPNTPTITIEPTTPPTISATPLPTIKPTVTPVPEQTKITPLPTETIIPPKQGSSFGIYQIIIIIGGLLILIFFFLLIRYYRRQKKLNDEMK